MRQSLTQQHHNAGARRRVCRATGLVSPPQPRGTARARPLALDAAATQTCECMLLAACSNEAKMLNLGGIKSLKEIIQQVIIEGTVNSTIDEGCTGVIENFAKSKGIRNISEKLSANCLALKSTV